MSDRMKSVVFFVFAACWISFAINVISWYGR